jgi:hypothetical protein
VDIWSKEHIQRKGKGDISEEEQEMIEDKDKWLDKTSLLKGYYESRKGWRINEHDSFMSHQKGPITSTYTTDWFLREGEGRELLVGWMKMTSVRSQDQRRMLQTTSHIFPSNDWIHRITQGNESNKFITV